MDLCLFCDFNIRFGDTCETTYFLYFQIVLFLFINENVFINVHIITFSEHVAILAVFKNGMHSK